MNIIIMMMCQTIYR